ncbi:hypothetical protein [Peribacillus sp. NPDC096448]|uniref:hypothetical protein n=1 Tax=Peribacillus sp. NPDC096448 TaxID=3364395 RepID=UPI003810E5EA
MKITNKDAEMEHMFNTLQKIYAKAEPEQLIDIEKLTLLYLENIGIKGKHLDTMATMIFSGMRE